MDYAALKRAVHHLKEHPDEIHKPELKFFKDYLLSLNAKLPTVSDDDLDAEIPDVLGGGGGGGGGGGNAAKPAAPPEAEPAPEPEVVEPEEEPPEEPEPDVLAPDEVDPAEHEMGDTDRMVTDEEVEQAQQAKELGQQALESGDFAEAVRQFTQALKLNPGAAMLYASRGNVFLKMRRPNVRAVAWRVGAPDRGLTARSVPMRRARRGIRAQACILDCDEAVKINPNSAKAYKIRGRAYALLGKWEQALQCVLAPRAGGWVKPPARWGLKHPVHPSIAAAHRDLQRANALDYDEDTYEESKRVKAKLDAAQARAKARQERQEAKRRRAEASSHTGGAAGNGSGAGKGGGFAMPGGLNPDMLKKLMSNPTVIKLMQNKKIADAFAKVMADPSKMAEVLKDPEIAAAVKEFEKVMKQ